MTTPSRVVGPLTGVLRCARALVVSFVALALALAGHLYGGGGVPSVWAFGLVWLVASLACWRLSTRRWTAGPLTGALILVQSLMHVTCALDSAPSAGASGRDMLAAHVVATVISVAALGYAESTLWALVEAWVLRPVQLAAPARSLIPDPPSRSVPVDRTRPRRLLLVLSDPRRGPPAVA